MWGRFWTNLYAVTVPYKNVTDIDVSETMVKQVQYNLALFNPVQKLKKSYKIWTYVSRVGMRPGSSKKQRNSSCLWVSTKCFQTSGTTPCWWNPLATSRWSVTQQPGTWETGRTSGEIHPQTQKQRQMYDKVLTYLQFFIYLCIGHMREFMLRRVKYPISC